MTTHIEDDAQRLFINVDAFVALMDGVTGERDIDRLLAACPSTDYPH
jgi:hypothetical protein